LRIILIAICASVCWGQDSVRPSVAPEWEIAAGNKMAFEIASVKPVAAGVIVSAGFPMDAGTGYRFTGGRFSATFPPIVYVIFAYKLTPTLGEIDALLAPLPKWVGRDSFQIQARTPTDNPSKDQMRLMMQSLLTDRFRMSVHFETQTVSALALVVTKPGKLGPQLHPHSEGPACPAEPGTPNFVPENVKDVFPQTCGFTEWRASQTACPVWGHERWSCWRT
jgi:uncharacterized protein (TIGR03435 family)